MNNQFQDGDYVGILSKNDKKMFQAANPQLYIFWYVKWGEKVLSLGYNFKGANHDARNRLLFRIFF